MPSKFGWQSTIAGKKPTDNELIKLIEKSEKILDNYVSEWIKYNTPKKNYEEVHIPDLKTASKIDNLQDKIFNQLYKLDSLTKHKTTLIDNHFKPALISLPHYLLSKYMVKLQKENSPTFSQCIDVFYTNTKSELMAFMSKLGNSGDTSATDPAIMLGYLNSLKKIAPDEFTPKMVKKNDGQIDTNLLNIMAHKLQIQSINEIPFKKSSTAMLYQKMGGIKHPDTLSELGREASKDKSLEEDENKTPDSFADQRLMSSILHQDVPDNTDDIEDHPFANPITHKKR